MKIGYSLSNNQGMEDIQGVIDLAVGAEELGFDSVWASEHVFNVSYVYDRIGDKPYYEPLTVLTYVAAKTTTIGLGTSVLVLPYHNPIRLAKEVATLDQISGGRFLFGVGAVIAMLSIGAGAERQAMAMIDAKKTKAKREKTDTEDSLRKSALLLQPRQIRGKSNTSY